MAVRTCDHLKEDGVYCNSPALKGRNYCYFHLNIRGRRLNMAPARALGPEQPLNVPFPEDMHAVQVTLFEVVSALAHNRIDTKHAGLILYAMQQAATNLMQTPDWHGRCHRPEPNQPLLAPVPFRERPVTFVTSPRRISLTPFFRSPYLRYWRTVSSRHPTAAGTADWQGETHMNTTLATCKHTYDNGGTCNSAAARGRDHCVYHLRYRARHLRMAQTRARNERFDLKLPPLEDMFAVQSALNQLVEAVAADMIDLKRAHFLLSALRAASKNLLARDKWPASIAHSEHPASDVDLAAEYGLPKDLDLNLPPEVAFPSSPAPAAAETGNWQPATGDSDLSPMPTLNYCKDGPGCPEHTIRADFPYTPEGEELRAVLETQGQDAATVRYKQQQRNRQRRYVNADRKRYAALALQKNLRLAAERLAEQKLAAEKAAAQAANIEPASTKKPPASTGADDTQLREQQAKKTA